MNTKMRKSAAALVAGVMAVAALPMASMAVSALDAETGYAWVAGDYYVNPGEEVCIEPIVKNAELLNAEGVAAWGFDFEDGLYEEGVLEEGDYEKGSAYNGIPGIMPNYEELHFVATSADEALFTAESDQTLLSIYYTITTDVDKIQAAAAKLGATVIEKEGKTYYSFPLKFDVSAPSEHDDVKCTVKIGTGPETYEDLVLVNGTINIQVDGASIPEDDFMLGDVNLDGKVDINDGAAVLSYYALSAAGSEVTLGDEPEKEELRFKAADVNKDGQVDINDGAAILAYYSQGAAGMEPSWD